MVQSRLQEIQQQEKVTFDFVIPYVHSGDNGRELKKALSTLSNVLDWSGKVWVIGENEPWFMDMPNLHFIPCKPDGNKWVGIQSALTIACKTSGVSEQFYYSNDDIYIHDQFERILPMYRETIAEQTANSDDPYSQSLIATERLLKRLSKIEDVLNYETHTPLFVDKAKLASSLDNIKNIQHGGYMTLQLRTYYGNIWSIGGEQIVDGKHKEGLAITSS